MGHDISVFMGQVGMYDTHVSFLLRECCSITGARKCPGSRVATNEVQVLLAQVRPNF